MTRALAYGILEEVAHRVAQWLRERELGLGKMCANHGCISIFLLVICQRYLVGCSGVMCAEGQASQLTRLTHFRKERQALWEDRPGESKYYCYSTDPIASILSRNTQLNGATGAGYLDSIMIIRGFLTLERT